MKWTSLTTLFVIELGSLIYGVAPNLVALIVGGVIPGLGSAGLFSGTLTVVKRRRKKSVPFTFMIKIPENVFLYVDQQISQ